MKTYTGAVTPDGMNWTAHVDGRPLKPRFDLYRHSPDGFAWGYGGSGPAQLALALCADILKDDARALSVYQLFKAAFVTRLDKDEPWRASEEDLRAIIEACEARRRTA